jgi:hypothetical protein
MKSMTMNKTKNKIKQRPDHIIEVTTLKQFNQIMQDTNNDTITVVQWYASWC